MKQILFLILLSLGAKAQDTLKENVLIKLEPIPAGVTVIKTVDLLGKEVPFESAGLTFWILSDGTIRKYYRL